MSRSIWKSFYITKLNLNIKNNIWKRNTIITQNFCDTEFLVHNGKEFKKVYITRPRLGFKLGEFSFTRIIKDRKRDEKKKNKKKKKKKKKKRTPIGGSSYN